MNLATWIVAAVLVLVLGAIVVRLVRNRKAGKSSCGCSGCSGCGGACHCQDF